MTERKLKEYFENILTVDDLAIDLMDSQKQTGHDVTSVYVEPIESDEQFEINKQHLVKLCNDVINGKLAPADLNTIFICNNYFRIFS